MSKIKKNQLKLFVIYNLLIILLRISNVFLIVKAQDLTPPVIAITPPQETTYDTNSVDLTFSIDEATNWIAYSLGGAANTTKTGNTPISNLTDGSHTIIVYATDLYDNTGTSKQITFTITNPPNKHNHTNNKNNITTINNIQ